MVSERTAGCEAGLHSSHDCVFVLVITAAPQSHLRQIELRQPFISTLPTKPEQFAISVVGCYPALTDCGIDRFTVAVESILRSSEQIDSTGNIIEHWSG